MKKITLFISLALCSLSALAQIPSGYYLSTAGKTGLKLKHELHKIISQKNISWHYGDLPAYYVETDSDHYYENDGSMLDIYSENPSGVDPYNYDWTTAALISGAGTEGLGYNREHILSQSFFYGCYPMYSDLHFVIPTDARVNQRRSNLPFGKVNASPTFTSLNGTKVGISASPGYTLTLFEPIDEFKGDIARMLLYAAVRYENLIGHFDTSNSRNPFYHNTESTIRPWQLNVLKSWHLLDPVSEREIDRNNKVYTIQGSRNPFIDHPEWVEEIWPSTPISDLIAPDVPIYLTAESTGARFIHTSWEPAEATDVLGYEIKLNGDIIGRVNSPQYVLHHLEPSTTYNLEVRSYDVNYNFSDWSLTLTTSTLAEDTFAQDIIISKVIEGSGNNKAIEIQNHTGYTVDLRDYTINMRQVNSSTGSLYWSGNSLRLEGELQHGQSYVIIHPEAALECMTASDADNISASTPLTFDGKMALVLSYKNTFIDMFGSEGNREPFAVDESLYRKPSIKNPTTVFNHEEWFYHPMNHCEGLGTASTTSIDNINKSKMSLYPNPVKRGEYINIEFDQIIDHAHISLIDINGRVVDEWEKSQLQKNRISTEKLTPGTYFIKINASTQKFIIIE